MPPYKLFMTAVLGEGRGCRKRTKGYFFATLSDDSRKSAEYNRAQPTPYVASHKAPLGVCFVLHWIQAPMLDMCKYLLSVSGFGYKQNIT